MQPISTFAEVSIEFQTPLADPFTYQQIRTEAIRLFSLGLSFVQIAMILGVTDKTAKKAVFQK